MIRERFRNGLSYLFMVVVCVVIVALGLDTAKRGIDGMIGVERPAGLFSSAKQTVPPGDASVEVGPHIIGRIGGPQMQQEEAAPQPSQSLPRMLTWSDELNLGAEKGSGQLARFSERAGLDLGQWLSGETTRVVQMGVDKVFQWFR